MKNNKPFILLPGKYSTEHVDAIRNKYRIWEEIDIVERQAIELAEIRWPDAEQRKAKQDELIGAYAKDSSAAAWVYYPWSGVLLHCLGPDELFELRTNRNRNLITTDEQEKLNNAVIGVAGMSVGSGIAIGTAYSGISDTIKLADFDELETANLNRVRESLSNVGKTKIHLAAQSIWAINPFSNQYHFQEGIAEDNIDSFFTDPDLHLVVDEIDDFKMKVLLRMKAKEYRTPLLMFTSLGDNILVDVERYDLPDQPEIFNGAIGNVADEILGKKNITDDDIKSYAVRTVGAEYVPTRALESLPLIGVSLVGRPQLYSTIAVDGGLAVYVIRQILLGSKLKSGRYFIKFPDLFDMETKDFVDTDARENVLEKLMGPNHDKQA